MPAVYSAAECFALRLAIRGLGLNPSRRGLRPEKVSSARTATVAAGWVRSSAASWSIRLDPGQFRPRKYSAKLLTSPQGADDLRARGMVRVKAVQLAPEKAAGALQRACMPKSPARSGTTMRQSPSVSKDLSSSRCSAASDRSPRPAARQSS